MTVAMRPIRLLAVAVTLTTILARIVQPHATSAETVTAGEWDQRLEALRPQEPERYLELAEEVEDAAKSEDDKRLARQLYALAGALEPERLGRSACLALAAMEENELAKKRFLALAALLPGMGGGAGAGANSAEGAIAAEWSPAAAVAVAEALSHYRRGDGSRALTALKEPGADQLLQQFSNMLPGGYQRFMEDCKAYKGQQAPTLSSADVIRMLRFESSILAGRDRAWSSELLLSAGQALIEVDPQRLEDSLNVDLTRPIYRSGRWVEK